MNEADRIAAQRAAERDRAARDAAAEDENRRREHIRSLIAQAKALAPQVLRAKEMTEPKFDGIENVGFSVSRKGLSKLMRGYYGSATKGGYQIQDFPYQSLGTTNTGWIYLLTDETLVVGATRHTIDEYGQAVLDQEGLGDPKSVYSGVPLGQYRVWILERLVESMKRHASASA